MATQWPLLDVGDPYEGGLRISGVPRLEDCFANGITAVLSVTTQPSPEAITAVVRWSWHSPLADGHGPLPVTQLSVAIGLVTDLLDVGHRVLVHCRAGRNRSALVGALVVRRALACSGAEALDWVRDRRPRALANPTFETYLRSLP